MGGSFSKWSSDEDIFVENNLVQRMSIFTFLQEKRSYFGKNMSDLLTLLIIGIGISMRISLLIYLWKFV